jgi:thioredoxin reductase (NADPH)
MTTYDAVIVGAGPAGLTAAIYLARYRRSVLVLDGGPSRASWIPTSHNTPGFPQGVGGEALLDRLRAQALEFGSEIRTGMVEGLSRADDLFVLMSVQGGVRARAVVLATGVVDRIPPIKGITAAIQNGRVRMCPICDAYEAIDRQIAVLSDGPLGAREAAFLQTYSRKVTSLSLGVVADAHRDPRALRVSLQDLALESGGVVLRRSGHAELRFDHLYLALGCAPQAGLAVNCGAAQDETGNLIVDAHQMTSVPGLYAAGDVVRGLNQISVAAGEAAISATAIHNRLREVATANCRERRAR